jgi:hypothetical protein
MMRMRFRFSTNVRERLCSSSCAAHDGYRGGGRFDSGADVAAGQTVTATLGGFGPALAHGVARGTVTLRFSTGPSLDGSLPSAQIPVGSFAVTIP